MQKKKKQVSGQINKVIPAFLLKLCESPYDLKQTKVRKSKGTIPLFMSNNMAKNYINPAQVPNLNNMQQEIISACVPNLNNKYNKLSQPRSQNSIVCYQKLPLKPNTMQLNISQPPGPKSQQYLARKYLSPKFLKLNNKPVCSLTPSSGSLPVSSLFQAVPGEHTQPPLFSSVSLWPFLSHF